MTNPQQNHDQVQDQLELFNQQSLQQSIKYMQRPILFRLMTYRILPLGAFARLRVDHASYEECTVSIPGGWATRNPFGSTYWAAQGMAAEAASGLLPFMYCRAAPHKVNMILASCEAKFIRQCRGRSTFSCEGGESTRKAIIATLETGERELCTHKVIGRDTAGEIVSEWTFTWSLKRSSKS